MENLEAYLETHYEMVQAITFEGMKDNPHPIIIETQEQSGHFGLCGLAKKWTDEFKEKYKDVEWGIDCEFFDEIESFVARKFGHPDRIVYNTNKFI